MTTQRETTTAAGGSPVEREVGRLEPEHADGSEHYWDDRDEPFDEMTCERCHGDGMGPVGGLPDAVPTVPRRATWLNRRC